MSRRIEIKLHPVQHAFVHSKATFRGFVGGRGAGKALALDTPIPTPYGWTTQGDLAVGARVLDATGRPCRVAGVSPTWTGRPCYGLAFGDGTHVVADAAHEWPAGYRGGPEGLYTTADLADAFAGGLDPYLCAAGRTVPVVRCVATPAVPTRCVEVDSADHLYLCGRARVPTHNSFVGSYDLLRRAKPKRLYMVVAPTYRILKDASFRTFIDNCRKFNFVRHINHSDLRVELGNGAEVLFRSAENPDSLRGPNLSGCWVDEAQDVVEEAYDIMIACLREAGEQGWVGTTFTPKGKQHWTYKLFGKNEEKQEAGDPTHNPDVALYRAKTRDNPFLPATFEGTLRGKYTSERSRQELEGVFLDTGGKMFNRGWFSQILKAAPAGPLRRVRYWDKACLDNGTLIETDAGDVPIGQIKAGDRVLTRQGYCRVKWAGPTKFATDIVSLPLADGRMLTGTADHLVWTENRGWVPLADIGTGHALRDAAGGVARAGSAAAPGDARLVYDIQVEGVHEFFANGVLVHNSTEDGGCYTCGVLMAADYAGRYYVEDVVRGRWSTFQRDSVILSTAQMDATKYHHTVRIFIEQEPGSGGVDSLRGTVKILAGFPVFGHRPQGEKRVRAEPFAAQAEAGNVILVENPLRHWLDEYLDELIGFPEGLADQVDASSGAFNKLTEGNTASPVTSGAAPPAGGTPPPPAGDETKAQAAPGQEQPSVALLAARRLGGIADSGMPGAPGSAPVSGMLGGGLAGLRSGLLGAGGQPGSAAHAAGLLGLSPRR